MTTAVIVGLGLAAVGVAGRSLVKYAPMVTKNLEQKLASLPKASISLSSFSDMKYYKGGFDPKMTKREASLILGVSANANQNKIREAHKRIMILNHPDKGGSPYIASKLNEAKDVLENKKTGGQ